MTWFNNDGRSTNQNDHRQVRFRWAYSVIDSRVENEGGYSHWGEKSSTRVWCSGVAHAYQHTAVSPDQDVAEAVHLVRACMGEE